MQIAKLGEPAQLGLVTARGLVDRVHERRELRKDGGGEDGGAGTPPETATGEEGGAPAAPGGDEPAPPA